MRLYRNPVLFLILVTMNMKFCMALPYQTIELDLYDVSYPQISNISWTEACPGGETECGPGETCCPLKDQGKVDMNGFGGLFGSWISSNG